MDNKTARLRILKIYAIILSVGAVYVLWLLLTDIKIPCFSVLFIGVECPGCGVTRMFLSMLRFDFTSAFYYNPASFILFFMWNFIAFLYYWGKPSFIRTDKFLMFSLIISVILLCIVHFFRF